MTDWAGRFDGSVSVEQRGRWWVVQRQLVYQETGPGDAILINVTVPPGFLTDFASIPRVFWTIAYPTDPAYSAAAIVHDRLYETHQLPRAAADAVFLRAMQVSGTPWWKRRIMWRAVRVFGGSSYDTAAIRRAIRLEAAA